MTDVRLVAVEHGDSGYLVGPSMLPLLQHEVIPYLTTDCVIVVEGGRGRGILRPGNPFYEHIYAKLGPIVLSGITPVLHSDDAWYKYKTPQDVMTEVSQLDDYTAAAKAFLSINFPSTWEELIERVRVNNHQVTTQCTLPQAWVKYAKNLVEITAARDRRFEVQIHRHARQGKRVFFIGGLLHCITLTAKRGWPVLRYECSPEYIADLYSSWYITNKITEHFHQ